MITPRAQLAGLVPNKSGLLALGSRLAETDARAMVIRYFAEIPFDFASGESCLLEAASDFALAVPVFEAEDGRRYLSGIGIGPSQGPQTKQALMVRFGKPIRGPSVTKIPVCWEPQGSAQLFPTLAGELDIVEAVGGRSRLTLSIDCAPPTGVPEGAVHRGLTYRVSWVTLNDIEARITACVGRLIKGRGPAPGPLPEAPRRVA
jgi:hypothetical protein